MARRHYSVLGGPPRSSGLKRGETKASRLTPLYAARYGGGGRTQAVPQFISLDQMAAVPRLSVWAYAAVYRIARTLSECRWKVVERGTQRDSKSAAAKRIIDVLRHVNPDKTYRELAMATFVDWQLQGELITELSRHPVEDNVTELYHINPKHVDPVPGRNRLTAHYVATVDGQTRTLPRRDIVRAVNYNSESELRGLSPVLPIRQALATDINAERYNASLVEKGGRRGGMLVPREGEYFGEEEFDSLVEHVKKQIFGVINAGELFIVPPGMEFIEAGSTLRDMDWLKLREYTREQAAAAFGATPMQVNNFESATYANSREQRIAFWDDTGLPHIGMWFGALNERWVQLEDVGLELVPDLQYVQALIDDKKTRSMTAASEYREGIATLNETRERVGLSRIAGGDVRRVSLNEMFVDLEGNVVDPLKLTGTTAPAGQPPAPKSARALVSPELVRVVKRAHLQDLRIAERVLIGVTSRMLQKQAREVVAAVRDAGDVGGLLQQTVFDTELKRVEAFLDLTPAVLQVVDQGGAAALRRLGGERRGIRTWEGKADAPFTDLELDVAFSIDNPKIAQYVRTELYQHISDMTERTALRLREVFEETIGRGEGASDLVHRIVESGIFGDKRAETIARTESSAAYNTGTHIGFVEAGVQGKSWLDAGFGKIRPSHSDVSKRTQAEPIPIEEHYELRDPARGVTLLPYPAAPSGPAHECVNCRCTELPEDDDGNDTRDFYVGECKGELVAKEKVA